MSVSTPSSENTPRGPHVKQTSLVHIWTVSTACLNKASARGPVARVVQSCSSGEALSRRLGYLGTASTYFTSGA